MRLSEGETGEERAIATPPAYVTMLDPKRCMIVNPGELSGELGKLGFSECPINSMRITFPSLRSGEALASFCNLLACLGIPFADGPADLLGKLKDDGFNVDDFWRIARTPSGEWKLTLG
jgi:hypothetical protein